jgi:hypothetical protein
MERYEMKTGILLVLLPLVGACSHQARTVDCDEHLTAINVPTSIVQTAKTPTAPAITTKPETP